MRLLFLLRKKNVLIVVLNIPGVKERTLIILQVIRVYLLLLC